MNNLPKTVTKQYPARDLNRRLLDCESDALMRLYPEHNAELIGKMWNLLKLSFWSKRQIKDPQSVHIFNHLKPNPSRYYTLPCRHTQPFVISDIRAVADQELANGGAKVERRRREYRGAEGVGWLPPPQKIFLTLDLKMSTSSAFWALFFAVQLPILQARNTAFGLTKLAAAACMQCTAQRQQKAANTSLLESRNLVQIATLVFPRPIVCSRLSNNINILAKKIFRPPTGGHAPRPPWIRHWWNPQHWQQVLAVKFWTNTLSTTRGNMYINCRNLHATTTSACEIFSDVQLFLFSVFKWMYKWQS